MHACLWGTYLMYETTRDSCRIGAAAASGRPAHWRRVFNEGGGELLGRQSFQRAPMGHCLSPRGTQRTHGAGSSRQAGETVADPREDRSTLADAQPPRIRLRHRVVDLQAVSPNDRRGVRRAVPSGILVRLAAGPQAHPAQAPAGGPRARSGTDRPAAGDAMAPHQKKARRRGAHLVVIDESGLLMAPLVRRTWAVRGQPPVLVQRAGPREKVSVAAALWLSPRRARLGV